MILRLAVKTDIDDIAKLRLKMLREYDENLPDSLALSIRGYLERHIADKSCICYLAEVDGAIVSMAMLCIYEEMPDEMNHDGICAKLCAAYTEPEFRGKGYMEKLLLRLVSAASGAGVKTILAAAERRAMPLYERVGFHTADTIMYMDL